MNNHKPTAKKKLPVVAWPSQVPIGAVRTTRRGEGRQESNNNNDEPARATEARSGLGLGCRTINASMLAKARKREDAKALFALSLFRSFALAFVCWLVVVCSLLLLRRR